LGSGLSLVDCFWGHERGVFCDLVDFEFAQKTDIDLVARLLTRFQHTQCDSQGREAKQPVWYRDSEIAAAISKQFPLFKRHFVWHAIPELRLAVDKNGLEFKSILAVDIFDPGRSLTH
jgi:hypothetical protein